MRVRHLIVPGLVKRVLRVLLTAYCQTRKQCLERPMLHTAVYWVSVIASAETLFAGKLRQMLT